MILDAIRESGSTGCAVDESGSLDWMKLAMTSEGVSVCPESAACVGASIRLRASGWLTPTDRVVLYNCGAAQKYVDVSPLRMASGDFTAWRDLSDA